jgi:hypothetical protein
MFLTWLMLAVALSLSTIAAFYSIIGLTAIFASAVVPVAIMGSILEIAKLVVTVWLHEYWHRCRRLMKVYLVPAVGVLMLITSMGIFGFLSKAHLDQTVISGDSMTRIAIYDEKIKQARENIDTNRRALKQMDEAVDQQMSRSTDEQGAQRAANLRRNQQGERTRLQREIETEQRKIQTLSEERAPVAAEVRKVEAEVGPIKYIAALIYGDNPDANLLEKAVRWVIIILVVVFDPLAIFMLLAATESYKWEKYGSGGDPKEKDDQPPQQPVNDAVTKTKIWAEDLWNKVKGSRNATVPDDATVSKNLDGQPTRDSVDSESMVTVVEQSKTMPPEQWGGQDLTENLSKISSAQPKPSSPVYVNMPDIVGSQSLDEESYSADDMTKAAQRRWKSNNPDKTLKEQRHLLETGQIDRLPWEPYLRASQSGFGAEFPIDPEKGQIWIRTDHLPTTLHKFNGEKWIEVVKDQSDSYAFNEEYINHLIGKIGSGEYDPELLTDAERLQIESRLRTDLA